RTQSLSSLRLRFESAVSAEPMVPGGRATIAPTRIPGRLITNLLAVPVRIYPEPPPRTAVLRELLAQRPDRRRFAVVGCARAGLFALDGAGLFFIDGAASGRRRRMLLTSPNSGVLPVSFAFTRSNRTSAWGFSSV